METKQSRALRVVGIVLMGSTAAMNILGGIGTVCAAFLTKDFPPMWALLDYQWLYQSVMILTIIVGLVGAWATIRLVRGGVNVYRDALILLAVGSVLAAIQMFASLALRGKAVPANMKFYINLLTLIYFLALRLPGLRGKVDFGSPGTRRRAACPPGWRPSSPASSRSPQASGLGPPTSTLATTGSTCCACPCSWVGLPSSALACSSLEG